MQVSIKFSGGTQKEQKHWEGILLSFFNAAEEILVKKRPGSFINHFYLERLDRNERRILSQIFAKIIQQLTKDEEKISINASSLETVRIPKRFLDQLDTFRGGISRQPTVSHQDPKVGINSSILEELKLILKEVSKNEKD